MLTATGSLTVTIVFAIMLLLSCIAVSVYITRVEQENLFNVCGLIMLLFVFAFMSLYAAGATERFLCEPVDVTVLDIRGNVIDEFKNVPYVREENHILIFEYEGREVKVDNWTCRFAENGGK